MPRAGRIVGKVRHHFGCEQPHGFLRGAEIKRAEIDLQGRMLEVADRGDDALDNGLDLVRGAAGRSDRASF